MDSSVVKSAISSVVLYLIGLAAGKLGLTPDMVTGLANGLDTVIFIGGSAVAALVLTWWKARQHTQTAQIQAVNDAPNGVKVVPATAPTPAVSGPLK